MGQIPARLGGEGQIAAVDPAVRRVGLARLGLTDRTTLPGDVVDVVVVDLGGPESLAMFWGAVPIGDEDLIAQLDQVIGELRAG